MSMSCEEYRKRIIELLKKSCDLKILKVIYEILKGAKTRE